MGRAHSEQQTDSFRFFNNNNQNGNISLSMKRMGMLYTVASIFQLSFLYHLFSSQADAKEWVNLPMIGWVYGSIWILMIWCTVHLFVLGMKMVRLSQIPDSTIMQTEYDRKRQRNVAGLLIVGIIVDTVMFRFMLNIEDKSAVVFMASMFGFGVASVNLVAILEYHNN